MKPDRRTLLLFSALGLGHVAGAGLGSSAARAALGRQESGKEKEEGLSDRLMRRAFKRLDKEGQRDVVEWLRLELLRTGNFQNRVLAILLDREPTSPDMWPPFEEFEYFDPKVHTADLKKKIRRKRLSPRSPKAKKVVAKFLGKPDETTYLTVWRYNWGDQRIYRNGERIDPERLFENAMRGHPPDIDLVHELALKALDDGREQKILQAFGHAYSDRSGFVYPWVTIYDAWSSGQTIEMPDVDVLGIVHDVLGDWDTWKAPIPQSQQEKIYAKVGELFQRARRYRALREALAGCLLVGTPKLTGGYEASLDALHALWDEYGSDPARLREDLPDGESWRQFLVDWLARVQGDRDLLNRGRRRRATLDRNAATVRQVLGKVMDEYGALESVKDGR